MDGHGRYYGSQASQGRRGGCRSGCVSPPPPSPSLPPSLPLCHSLSLSLCLCFSNAAAAEKVSADATVPSTATPEAAGEPRSAFPPGVFLNPETHSKAVSGNQLPRLLSGTEEWRLQDYYDLQTGIAFDLMSVNFADLEHLPGEFGSLSMCSSA